MRSRGRVRVRVRARVRVRVRVGVGVGVGVRVRDRDRAMAEGRLRAKVVGGHEALSLHRAIRGVPQRIAEGDEAHGQVGCPSPLGEHVAQGDVAVAAVPVLGLLLRGAPGQA